MKTKGNSSLDSAQDKWEEYFKKIYPFESVTDGIMTNGVDPKDAKIIAEVYRNEIILFIRKLLQTTRRETLEGVKEKFSKLAIKGAKDEQVWKGANLFARMSAYLDEQIEELKK